MTTISLRKYYYPTYKTDVFVEVSDEVAEAMKHFDRQMNNYQRRTLYHNALCRKCRRSCKQSFRADMVDCPLYYSKRAKDRPQGGTPNVR